MDDLALIRRIVRKHDAAAANDLVTRYYDELYRYAYRQSLALPDPRQEAMDLTQEIFVAALRSLSSYNPKKSSFRTWLYHVASSRIIDARRKFSPEQVQIDTLALSSYENLTLNFEDRELAAQNRASHQRAAWVRTTYPAAAPLWRANFCTDCRSHGKTRKHGENQVLPYHQTIKGGTSR